MFVPLNPGPIARAAHPHRALDAPLEWADASDFEDYRSAAAGAEPLQYLVLIELLPLAANQTREAQVAALTALIGPPPLALWGADSAFCVCVISRALLLLLATLPPPLADFEVSLMPHVPRSRVPHAPVLPALAFRPPAPAATTSTLVGFVDHGCPFAHPGLRHQNGSTRVLWLWDLGRADAAHPNQLGRFFARADLLPPQGPMVDEAAIYRRQGFHELLARASHGAHVMGLVVDPTPSASLVRPVPHAGVVPATPWQDMATRADIAFVQLPATYLHGSSRSALGPYRLLAIFHILSSAVAAGEGVKHVVVPIASDHQDGPHDGSSMFERALDALIQFAGLAGKSLQVPLASGNAARRSSRGALGSCHRRMGALPAGQNVQLRVRVLPGSERPTFVELWLPGGSYDVGLTLQAPGYAAETLAPNDNWVWEVEGVKLCAVVHPRARPGCILLRIGPTLVSRGPAAPSGDWVVTLRSTAGCAQDVWAFVARSEHGIGGVRRAYQAYLPVDDPRADAEDVVKGSVSGLACGSQVKVIASHRVRDGHRAWYAGRLPARGGTLAGCEGMLTAPTEESTLLRGLLGWGNLGGQRVRLSGTSAAAALAARELAEHAVLDPRPVVGVNQDGLLDPQRRLG